MSRAPLRDYSQFRWWWFVMGLMIGVLIGVVISGF